MKRLRLASLAVLVLAGCGGKAVVDGTNGPADCNLEEPCDDTHGVAQG